MCFSSYLLNTIQRVAFSIFPAATLKIVEMDIGLDHNFELFAVGSNCTSLMKRMGETRL